MSHRLTLTLVLWLVGSSLPAPARAQAPRPPWSVAARHQSEVFDGDREAWHVSDLTLERRFSGGAVLLSGGRTERFGQAAAVGTAEVYKTITPKLYGNARLSLAPGARTVARSDAALNLYAALPAALEGSVGVRRIDYADGGATLLSLGATHFRRWGRLGAIATAVPADSVVGVSAGLNARLDLGPPASRSASYIEVRGGRGEEVVPTAGGAADLRTSWTASLGGAVRVGRRATLGASVGRAWDSALARTSAEARFALDL